MVSVTCCKGSILGGEGKRAKTLVAPLLSFKGGGGGGGGQIPLPPPKLVVSHCLKVTSARFKSGIVSRKVRMSFGKGSIIFGKGWMN